MMNWETIQYIFQIPLDWYKKIHAKVFNAYGTNFIRVRDGDNGAMHIDVDEDAFRGAVESYNTAVKTVNSISPDGNGNVDVGTVKSVNNTQPDSNGNVAITIPAQTVRSVDHKSPDQQGNIQLNAICTINGHNGDSDGNFAGVVTSVNSIAPDANGNVDVDVVQSVNGNAPDSNGDVDLGDIVYTVDGHSPDSNGAVSFGLPSSKWMKTDASGHVATTDETPIALPSGKTGQTTTLTVVTDVTWNGTTLQKKTKTLTLTSGVVTAISTETTSTIDTPVAYSP